MPSPHQSSAASCVSLASLECAMTLTIPTFTQGNIVGYHIDSYCSYLEETYLVERKEYDLSGNLLWQVKRELGLYNESTVLPQSSTIVYKDGTMVISLREYTTLLQALEERLYIDGVQQMCKTYNYQGEKLVGTDQTIFTVQGTFSRRQCDQLITKDGHTFSKRQVLDEQGKVITDYPEIASEELVNTGVAIDI